MFNPECLKGEDFINKFSDDYLALEKLGYHKQQILRMLGTLQYVQDFCDTPSWLESVKKLPRGHKWSEGRKFWTYSQRYGGKPVGRYGYTFLTIDDDLYIKGLVTEYTKKKNKDGSETYEHRDIIALIRNWKTYTAKDILDGFDAIIDHLLHDAVLTFWRDNNLPLGWIESILKPFSVTCAK